MTALFGRGIAGVFAVLGLCTRPRLRRDANGAPDLQVRNPMAETGRDRYALPGLVERTPIIEDEEDFGLVCLSPRNGVALFASLNKVLI